MSSIERPREGIHPGIIFVVLLVVLGAAAFLWWRATREPTPAPPSDLVSPSSPSPATGASTPPPPALPLPPLADSDPLVRELVGRLSAHPKIASWLITDHLIERFVAAVDNVARGESPRGHLEMLAPEGGFEATTSEDGAADGSALVISSRSRARYDFVATVIDSLDTAGTAALYRQLRPLFDEAYRELGYPEGDFSAVLAQALDQLQAVPVVESPTLSRSVEGFRFADPALESLSEAQKHLLRMGPETTAQVQEKIRRLRRAAGV